MTGPKIDYNRELMIADLKSGMSNTEVAKKHSVSYKIVANCRGRYIYGKAKIVPTLEKAIKRIERGWPQEKIISLYGEEVYQEAKMWV